MCVSISLSHSIMGAFGFDREQDDRCERPRRVAMRRTPVPVRVRITVLYAVQPQITHPVRRSIITLIPSPPSLAWRGVCIAWHSDGGGRRAEGKGGRGKGRAETWRPVTRAWRAGWRAGWRAYVRLLQWLLWLHGWLHGGNSYPVST